jgi:hypothetical protein
MNMADTADTTELHIISTKKAELEFDVHIQGINSDEPMEVRFLIKDADFDGTMSFTCIHVEGDKWCVKFPVLKNFLKKQEYAFVLEVIVDGYYFAPVEGKVSFISDPTVDMSKKKRKPSVKAAFTVKQDAEVVEERVAQAAGTAGEATDPSNQLLTPEFPAEKLPDEEVEDEEEDTAVSMEPAPTAEGFNPTTVAENILKSTFGNVQLPSSKGFLFSRSGDGKPVVKGLEDKATKQQLQDKAERVKQILAGE